MKHLGDFDTSTVIDDLFTTYSTTTGAPATLGGSGVSLVVYKDNGTTQSSAGITLTPDFDSKTGLNHYRIDTSVDGTFYSAGSFFNVVIEAGTVGAVSVVGSVVGSFTLRKNSALKPTTAGRTLDVSSGGEAGIDWANIGSPTTAVNLSATNIDVDQVVASVSGSVGSVATGGITEASFATTAGSFAPLGVVDQGTAQAATGTTLQLRSAAGFADDELVGAVIMITGGSAGVGQARVITDYVSSTDTATVDAWTTTPTGTITYKVFASPPDDGTADAIKLVTDKLDGMLQGDSGSGNLYQFTVPALAQAPTGGSAPTAAAIADAVWDEALSGHLTAGSAGEALSTAETAADRFGGMIQGDSGSGNTYQYTAVALAQAPAGGTGLDAAGVRAAIGLASANLDTQLSGIQADTDDIQTRIPAALVGGRMDASVGAMAANTLTASALATDAVTEIQSGLATAAALATVDTVVDAILVDTAEIGAAGAGLTALASATALATLDDFVDTEVAAIKAKTDSLTFTVAGKVDANITHVIGDAVQTNGSTTTNWGGTP
jgi:hypothetical protein